MTIRRMTGCIYTQWHDHIYIYIQLYKYTYSSELYNSRLEPKQLIESIYNDHVKINIVSVQVAPITNMFLEEIPHFSWLCASFCLPLPHPFSSLAIHSLLAYIGLHALGLIFFSQLPSLSSQTGQGFGSKIVEWFSMQHPITSRWSASSHGINRTVSTWIFLASLFLVHQNTMNQLLQQWKPKLHTTHITSV